MLRVLRRFLTLVILLAAGAAGAAFLWWNRLPQVATVAVTRGAVAEVVYATGVIEPVEWAKVVPLVRGRIVELCECEGRDVARGDMLARLDDTEVRAQAREIEARQEYAERHLARMQELRTRGVTTVEAYDRAAADVAQIRALLAAARDRIANLSLRAPRDGRVLRLDFRVGEIVGTSDVVAWVGRPAPLRVVAEVAEEDIAGVEPGQKVLIRHDGFRGRTLTADVERITPRGDPVQKVFRVYLSLPMDTPLRVGMTVEANIVTAERADALVVPVEAVRDGAVYLVADGHAVRRPVRVGLRGLRGIEIIEGVASGEQVVSPVPDGVRDHAPVRERGETIVAALRRFR